MFGDGTKLPDVLNTTYTALASLKYIAKRRSSERRFKKISNPISKHVGKCADIGTCAGTLRINDWSMPATA